jgi:hypothetical protein
MTPELQRAQNEVNYYTRRSGGIRGLRGRALDADARYRDAANIAGGGRLTGLEGTADDAIQGIDSNVRGYANQYNQIPNSVYRSMDAQDIVAKIGDIIEVANETAHKMFMQELSHLENKVRSKRPVTTN